MQFWLKFPSLFKVTLGFYILLSSLELLLFARGELQPFLWALVLLSVLQRGGLQGSRKAKCCRQFSLQMALCSADPAAIAVSVVSKAGRKRSCAQN